MQEKLAFIPTATPTMVNLFAAAEFMEGSLADSDSIGAPLSMFVEMW